MLQLGFGPIVTTNACLLIGKCRNVDFSWDERCPVLLSVLESCAVHAESSGDTYGSVDDPVRILERLRVRIRSSSRNI